MKSLRAKGAICLAKCQRVVPDPSSVVGALRIQTRRTLINLRTSTLFFSSTPADHAWLPVYLSSSNAGCIYVFLYLLSARAGVFSVLGKELALAKSASLLRHFLQASDCSKSFWAATGAQKTRAETLRPRAFVKTYSPSLGLALAPD